MTFTCQQCGQTYKNFAALVACWQRHAEASGQLPKGKRPIGDTDVGGA